MTGDRKRRAPADERARERIRTSLDESLLVEAAAGTGKTTVLVDRAVNVLRTGRGRVEGMVAVTFTRKAAGEMQLRLRQRLDEARRESRDPQERRRLERAIEHLEEAQIGTIHSFCAEILRERPVEARIDPGFEEMDEDEARALYERVFRRWVERRLDEMPSGLRRALSRLGISSPFGGEGPLERLAMAGWDLAQWRDFPAPWRREAFDREHAVDDLVDRVLELGSWGRRAANPRDYLRRALEPVESLADWIARTERAAQGRRDYDALEARLILDLRGFARDRRKGRGAGFAEGVTRAEALEKRAELIERREQFQRWAEADLAASLAAELAEVTAEYEDLKRRTGRLDFLDLLLSARDLVRSSREVRAGLQERFTHLFVDELQDTDPLQIELILLLAADEPDQDDWRAARPVPGKLFAVGDPKQSIYRFRRADVVLYQELRERLEEAGVGMVYLSTSFRSQRPIQEAVNAAFAPALERDERTGQPGYVALEKHRPEPSERPSVVALPVPRPYGPWGRVSGRAIEESLPPAVAAFVDWLTRESGWTVEEGGRQVPVEPRHVCLEFRRFASWGRDLAQEYAGELETRGVPYVLEGGRSLHQREEVETLRTALVAIEWPDDELAVFAALKGALFALPDDLLLRFRLEAGRLHPFRPAPEGVGAVFEPILEALELLARLHRERNRVPIAATLHRLLQAGRSHAAFAVRPAGSQALANVQQLLDRARTFERSGGLSFRGFVEQLLAEAERLTSRPAPPIDESAAGVRLITVHRAKGLQYPVVVLADPTARPASREPSGFVDAGAGLAARRLLGLSPWELVENAELETAREEAEGARIAYVAATRARDLLVVPVVGDEKWQSGWTSCLNPALYPPRERWREARPAPGCPDFGPASVLERPAELDREGEISVQPGLHRPERGDHQVVWWDPAVLELEVPSRFGLVQEEILAEGDDPGVARAGLERYHRWREAGERLRELGARPGVRLTAVTEVERGPEPEPPPPRVVRLERPDGRPAGARFGTLVHSVLRDAPFDARPSLLEELAGFHSRQLEAEEGEAAAAAVAVAAALAHPVVAAARGAERVHREMPFLLRLDEEGSLLEGVVDLAYRREGGWTVVDFKTDLVGGEPPPRYVRQLGWYVRAVERLTGEPAAGVLVGV